MYLGVLIVIILIAAIIYLIARQKYSDDKVKVAEETAKRILEEAKRNAETKKKEALLEAKEEAVRLRQEFEKESKERKTELGNIERRLLQREEYLEKKEKNIDTEELKLKEQLENVEKTKEELKHVLSEHIKELEKASSLPKEEAKKILLQNLEKELERDAALRISKNEEKIKQESEKKAREILVTAIQRCSVDHVVETTTSVVELPSDEMKGRIIGREGRNIRAFETLTGVDLVVDDTPEAVIISSFDPLRRETARRTLEKLIVDGRIHPARVEEMYNKSKEELKVAMWEAGEKAVMETDIHGVPPVLIQLLGRLKYRTSYGQNVLQHSIEMAHLAGMLASELGVNVKLAKRGALLHDIGKAIDQEVEGTHVKLGVLFAQKAGESPEVIHAIEAHHEDVQPKTIEAVLVMVADTISSSRPGARRDSLESYVKRLEKLESVAKSFEGVEKCFAIQAGREIRVIVQPDKIDDIMSAKLAHDIAKKIETELEYPGEIKVTVIRETRSTDVAK
ncbi:ribonuclease Y [candidate division WOR-1 bacterium RIFOXYD2_FULL_36_8]|uniref:Ribonuclease Y n=1 Tax=candidate division WOR-1 bacterium RIFOXYB2_FULL_36_35 TaxID=1802578 RepID=A0A1F4S3S9_UNCSA|nr:MAG: ribonuclease Y [candidate division WOR-1 bacterium RIFOXYA2_FULL_36_21]OGC15027.1 MAG: ribonuclease Y [candidate division WOR-1 bacterium RIFOXYB2_FULL_36_35]OGC18739.1 MAG: ribonuclease Y [candidate division WOR-1 bacterium RIFOXYA12_FULL_36_13]OGC37435.1 MAG: ribonuclease Y [candidate division WOR-1 bacterium RIFOXYD2_FULL_36_8]